MLFRSKLTTVEAIAGAAFIMGFHELGKELLSKFNWGHTFYELNENLLADYEKIEIEEQIGPLLAEYGIAHID